MKAAEFQVVAEARRAAREHLGFFNQMMAATTASTAGRRTVEAKVAKKQQPAKPPSKK